MRSSSRPRWPRSPSTGRPIFAACSDTKKIASPGFAPVAARTARAALVVGQKLRKRALRPARPAPGTRRPPRPSDSPSLDRLVEEAARLLGGAWRNNRAHDVARRDRLREHRELGVRGRSRSRRRRGSDCADPACRCRTPSSPRRRGCAETAARVTFQSENSRRQPGQHRLDRRKHVVLRRRTTSRRRAGRTRPAIDRRARPRRGSTARSGSTDRSPTPSAAA